MHRLTAPMFLLSIQCYAEGEGWHDQVLIVQSCPSVTAFRDGLSSPYSATEVEECEAAPQIDVLARFVSTFHLQIEADR